MAVSPGRGLADLGEGRWVGKRQRLHPGPGTGSGCALGGKPSVVSCTCRLAPPSS